jgi:hypothetical protein
MSLHSRWVVMCEHCDKALFITMRVDEEQERLLRQHLGDAHPELKPSADTGLGVLFRHFQFEPAPPDAR